MERGLLGSAVFLLQLGGISGALDYFWSSTWHSCLLLYVQCDMLHGNGWWVCLASSRPCALTVLLGMLCAFFSLAFPCSFHIVSWIFSNSNTLLSQYVTQSDIRLNTESCAWYTKWRFGKHLRFLRSHGHVFGETREKQSKIFFGLLKGSWHNCFIYFNVPSSAVNRYFFFLTNYIFLKLITINPT